MEFKPDVLANSCSTSGITIVKSVFENTLVVSLSSAPSLHRAESTHSVKQAAPNTDTGACKYCATCKHHRFLRKWNNQSTYNSAMVRPKAWGYCSVTMTGIRRIFAALSSRWDTATILSNWSITFRNYDGGCDAGISR